MGNNNTSQSSKSGWADVALKAKKSREEANPGGTTTTTTKDGEEEAKDKSVKTKAMANFIQLTSMRLVPDELAIEIKFDTFMDNPVFMTLTLHNLHGNNNDSPAAAAVVEKLKVGGEEHRHHSYTSKSRYTPDENNKIRAVTVLFEDPISKLRLECAARFNLSNLKLQIVERTLTLPEGQAVHLHDVYGIARKDAECVICLTEPADTTLLPCRHMCICRQCGETLLQAPTLGERKCPICRHGVDTLLKVERERVLHDPEAV